MPLHPVYAVARQAAIEANRPRLCDGTVEQARAMVGPGTVALGPGPAVKSATDIKIPTRDGAIGARLYKPICATTQGLIVYFHGGGWMTGTLDAFDNLARNMAMHSGCDVLSIDYRLAPEHKFPCGLRDAIDSLKWASSHRTELDSPHGPLMVAGDSAGANLAIVATLALKDDVRVAMQLLFYPVVDSDFETKTYRDYADEWPITRADMKWFFENYASEREWANPEVSPLRGSLKGSPKTWMALAEFDVLRSEGESFAERLRKEAVEVECRVVEGMVHGFGRWCNLIPQCYATLANLTLAIPTANH